MVSDKFNYKKRAFRGPGVNDPDIQLIGVGQRIDEKCSQDRPGADPEIAYLRPYIDIDESMAG